MTRRVVITGAGVLSPLGLTAAASWEQLLAGQSGAAAISGFDPTGLPVRIAAEVKGFDPVAHFGRYRAKHLDRFTQLALVAVTEAITQSGIDVAEAPFRVGVLWGTGIGGIGSLEAQFHVLQDKGAEKVSPYMCPMMIPNMAAGEIAMQLGAMGPSSCTVTACAASASAIGDGFELIRAGRADVIVAGGSEAAITPICLAGFAAMKALSIRNDDPEHASRPFDATRDGFVAGEGGQRSFWRNAATLLRAVPRFWVRSLAMVPRATRIIRRHLTLRERAPRKRFGSHWPRPRLGRLRLAISTHTARQRRTTTRSRRWPCGQRSEAASRCPPRNL